jgi:hypothetical protein
VLLENRLTCIEAELGEIRRTMATKTWVLGQTFVLLGGVASPIVLSCAAFLAIPRLIASSDQVGIDPRRPRESGGPG